MRITIRKLTPDLAEDYVSFFNTTPHSDNIDDHKCFCVCWCNEDYVDQDFSTPDKRRDYAIQYVKGNNIQGYLAYYGDKVVGWCNANAKSDCLGCYSWRRFMGSIPAEETTTMLKVKSVFCFAIAPEMKRQGIALRLLARVCQEAALDGFDFVEAYPNRVFVDEAEDFMGPVELYIKSSFKVHCEAEQKLVMRKKIN